jgi:Sec-independent protein translocase protein TatA
MAGATVIAIVVGALLTVLIIAFVVLVLAQRLRRAYREAKQALERLRPLLDGLSEQQQVTGRELARVGDAVDQLGAQRAARRRD